jgi:hypothetical protein
MDNFEKSIHAQYGNDPAEAEAAMSGKGEQEP